MMTIEFYLQVIVALLEKTMTPEEKLIEILRSCVKEFNTGWSEYSTRNRILNAMSEENESGIKVLLNKNVPPNEIWVNNGTEITRFIGLEQKE